MAKISIIGIGDELLIGQVIDTNSAFMGQLLNQEGMEVSKKICIADELEDIQLGLKECLAQSDVVLITGGLGPTKDDITKKALADFFGVELVFSDESWAHFNDFAQQLGFPLTDGHKAQAYMPANAQLFKNKMGTAPAMWMEHQGKVVVSMPGVPHEMKYLMTHEVVPRLKQKFELTPIVHRTLLTTGIGESSLAVKIEDIESSLPASIKLAFLPSLGIVRLRLTGRSENIEELSTQIDQYANALKERLSAYVFGEGDMSLAAAVGQSLMAKNKRMATAESCTGGHIAHLITKDAGSSAYFQGSIVAYDNAVKTKLLGVQPTTLAAVGAVSEQCVEEMAKGALEALDVDVALAISGIAGPGGGSAEKPVGTIWIAVADHSGVKTMLLKGGRKRLQNIQYASNRALGLLWSFLN